MGDSGAQVAAIRDHYGRARQHREDAHRGSSSGDGSSVRDSVVNTLLAQLDGVSQRSNVLVVGLTNRKDMLDPACSAQDAWRCTCPSTSPQRGPAPNTRHPRGVCVRTALWMDYRRHIAGMVVARTEGCTGADLAGLVRNAASLSMQRLARSHTGQPGTASASIAGRGPHISLQWRHYHRLHRP